MHLSSKNAALLIIGDEILSGRTKDANLAYLAEWLNGQGIQLAEARVVPDIEAKIIESVNRLRAEYDYVFTTGGIGPTHDDITAEAIAKAFGTTLEMRQEIADALQAYNDKAPMNDARLKMAYVPVGSELIKNSVSIAPGFVMENVYVMAGIPGVMRAMLSSLSGKLEGAHPMNSGAITAYIGESGIAKELATVQSSYDAISVGSYPFYRNQVFGTTIVVRSMNDAQLQSALNDVRTFLSAREVTFKEGELD